MTPTPALPLAIENTLLMLIMAVGVCIALPDGPANDVAMRQMEMAAQAHRDSILAALSARA